MRARNEVLWRLLSILALAFVGLGVPAVAAQEEDETVRLTVRLFLSGDVPEGEVFRVAWGDVSGPTGGSGPVPFYLCGGPMGVLQGDGPEIPCVGRAEPYVDVAERLPKGRTLGYRFQRSVGEEGNAEVLAQGTVTLDRDTTLTANYAFPNGGDGRTEDEQEMPDTGAGGITSGHLPAGVHYTISHRAS